MVYLSEFSLLDGLFSHHKKTIVDLTSREFLTLFLIISCSGIGAAEVASATAADNDQSPPPKIILKKKKFVGKYAISADEFTPDLVRLRIRL